MSTYLRDTPLGEGEPFNTYLTDADNYQIYQTSPVGLTGSFAGATVIQVNGSGNKGYTLESAASLATIAPNAKYTLTFAIANDGSGAGNVTLSLFSATSAANTNDYSGDVIPNSGGQHYPAPPNPVSLPIITTGAVYASNTIPGSTINSQAVEHFTDYSISFDTYGTDNAAAVGHNLYLGMNVDSNGSLQFDNVRLTELAVPEPSAWALMLAGLAGLFIVGRRKLKA